MSDMVKIQIVCFLTPGLKCHSSISGGMRLAAEHCLNMPMQCTAIFTAVKMPILNENFHLLFLFLLNT